MTPAEEAAPEMCADCAAKRRPEHYYGYCPHEQVLSIAIVGEAGNPCGFEDFGPLTRAEAQEAIAAGEEHAVNRAVAMLRASSDQEN